ncbi:MAG: XRE family transcriptional regulator [Rhodospirillales bacterium]|nr:XRE family transcriptional regulator [Rhodospirillales bacterium]
MTLDRLAEQTGFTKSYLSKIENGLKVPPIGSLARISGALGADIALFFQKGDAFDAGADLDSGVSCVRAGERQSVIRGGTSFGYDYESLAHKKLRKHMEPFLFTFPSHISREVFFEHEGEEFIFILSGRVEFLAGKRKFLLEPGDSLYIDSALPHRGRCLGGEAKALVVIFKPGTSSA